MGVTFDNIVDWKGSYVSLGDITYEKEVILEGEEGKDPIKDYASGGAVFQGTATFKDILKMTKMKFFCENVQTFEKEVTVEGPALGSIKNCPDIKKLTMKDNIETRVIRSHVKEDFTLETARGELMDVQVDKNLDLKKCGFSIRNNLVQKDFIANDCHLHGSQLFVLNDTSLEKTFFDLDILVTKTLTQKDTKLRGRNFISSDSYSSIENSTAQISKFATKKIEVNKSKLYGEDFLVPEEFTTKDSTTKIDEMKCKSLDFDNSYIIGTNFKVEEDVKLEKSALLIDMMTCKNINMNESHIQGRGVVITEDLTLDDSKFRCDHLEAKKVNATKSNFSGSTIKLTEDLDLIDTVSDISRVTAQKANLYQSHLFGTNINLSQYIFLYQGSSLLGKSVTTPWLDITESSSAITGITNIQTINVYEGSGFVGLTHTGSNLTTVGGTLLVSATTNVAVNEKGFIGISTSGQSNFSSMNAGVDAFAVPRINYRTRDDYISYAEKNSYTVADEYLLVQSGKGLFIESDASIYEKAGYSLLVDATQDITMSAMNINFNAQMNLAGKADQKVTFKGEQGLLCESGKVMNLIAAEDQLLKGGQVYAVSGGVPKFTPPDFCTAVGCEKPVWKEGGTDKSIDMPMMMPPLIPGMEPPD